MEHREANKKEEEEEEEEEKNVFSSIDDSKQPATSLI
jgi:hypothetical protein